MSNTARHAALLVLSVLAAGAGACGGSSSPLPSTPPDPHLIPGGGVADGPIRGALNVYVTDEDTRNVLSSAAVRIGAADELTPCEALTDSTGLVRFTSAGGGADGGTGSTGCKLLTKPVTLTVSASGHAPSTWIGVNGTNLTIALRAISAPALGRATVTGTIAGWETLPAPATNHQTLALIGASSNPMLTDRANTIDQGTRSVDVTLADGTIIQVDIQSNVCVRNANPAAMADDCNWILTTHTGRQAHFALLIDNDTKGTDDQTDDTNTVIGWAIKTGLSFGDGTTTGAEMLPVIADSDMQPFAATFAAGPAGLDYMIGYPTLDLGDDGRITIILPTLDKTSMMTRVPKLTGALAGGHYDLVAAAYDDATKALPSTITWLRGVDPSATTAVTSWLAPPSAIAMTAGVFSFSPVTGATVHSAELQTMDGQRRWAITIFDGTASFSLPGLSPDPLPLGTLKYAVSALRIPGVDLKNVVFDDLSDKVTDISSDAISYSR